jgi:hypothetical protein
MAIGCQQMARSVATDGHLCGNRWPPVWQQTASSEATNGQQCGNRWPAAWQQIVRIGNTLHKQISSSVETDYYVSCRLNGSRLLAM